PRRRYGSAEALAEDLERWGRGEPIAARPATTEERAIKWVRRRPAIAALSAAVFVVAVLGLAGVIWKWREAEANAAQAKAKVGGADQRPAGPRSGARGQGQRRTGQGQGARGAPRPRPGPPQCVCRAYQPGAARVERYARGSSAG